VLVGLLLVAGLGLAIVASQDDSVADAVSETVDEGVDTVTSAGDDAADTVTSAGGEAADTVTGAADDVADDVSGNDAQSASPVESDPVVKRLARGRDLPFTAGPWVRAAYRDTVYGRLRPATLTIARKVRAGQGYAIRFG
jgi:hypothetical protein